MKKILRIIKNNTCGFMIGVILTIFISVSAATTLSSSSVHYDNTNSGSTKTNVKDAIDDLYVKTEEAKNECPDGYTCTLILKYYAFGLPDTTSPTDYQSVITSSGSNVFVQLEGEQLSVCIYRNSTLECFKNNNYEEESEHLKQVFGEDSCSVSSFSATCRDDDFYCTFDSNRVRCLDPNYDCNVKADGNVSCG